MKSRKPILVAVLTLLAMMMLVGLAVQGQQLRSRKVPHYKLTVLLTLGGTFSQAGGLNNRGSVAGFSTLPGDSVVHAFRWQKGLMTDLGTLGGPNSFTSEDYPLNDRGEVSGFSNTATPDPNGEDFCEDGTNLVCLPFVWQKGVMTALPLLGGNNGIAFEINNRGQVVGTVETPNPDPTCVPPFFLQLEAVIWEEGGHVQELSPFPGDPDSSATGINDRGQAVGESGPCTLVFGNAFHALLWENGTPTDLGNLGGKTGNLASDINNQGQVVGQSDLPGDTTGHAFLWTKEDGMQDLGTLPGDVSSQGLGINNKGEVVGLSFDASGNVRGFLWQDGLMTDPNTLIPANSHFFVLEALGINDRGQIAGYGRLSNGNVHGYLLTPCDENHPDIEGCDYSVVDRAVITTAAESAPTTHAPAAANLPNAASDIMHRLRKRWAPWSVALRHMNRDSRTVSCTAPVH